MPSILVISFFLNLAIYLINTFGAQAINELLWNLYGKLPTSHSSDMRSQVELRREVVRLKREMNATSSQDEFAKWAKLRRAHDKALAQYEEKTSSLKAFKATFDRSVNVLRFLGTNGLRFLLQFWFAKQPMFWIPRGWVPGYVEWALSFPRAPKGSVSIQIWGIACATVVQLVGAAVVAAWALVVGVRDGGGKEKGKRVEMKVGAGGGEGKKEL